MENEKRKHHFVPRSFLRGFATDSKDSLIWGYDKKYGRCSGCRSIHRICSLDYYYEQVKPDGGKTEVLEDGFQTIEKPAIEIIRNLSASKALAPEEKGCLAFYIGLLLTRGPSFRDGVHECLKHSLEILLQKEYESGRLPQPPAIVKQHIVDGDITSVIKTEILPHASLEHMYRVAKSIGQSLLEKKWDIYHSESDDRFATSDTPVMSADINPSKLRTLGPAHPDSLILCPITKTTLLVVRPYYETDQTAYEFMLAREGMVAAVNGLMCFTAQRFVYASAQSQELLDCVKKAKGSHKKAKAYRVEDAIVFHWDVIFSHLD
jgi:uncharacterized protein DUF4238